MEQLVESMRVDRSVSTGEMREKLAIDYEDMAGFVEVREFYEKYQYPNFNRIRKVITDSNRENYGLNGVVKKVNRRIYLNELMMLEWSQKHLEKEIKSKGVEKLLDRKKAIAISICELKKSEV